MCFSSEKDLRARENIRLKAQYFTGIAVRVKHLTPTIVENVLKAVDLDHINFQQQVTRELEEAELARLLDLAKKAGHKTVEAYTDALGAPPEPVTAALPGKIDPLKCICHLRIEETRLTKRAVNALSLWLAQKQ